ncbi:hypothetical protein HpMS113_02510 [Helicobacter pylori]
MKYSPTTPKLNPPNPIRARYMRRLVGASSFILIAKTLKGINLITDTPLKIFIGFIKCVGSLKVMFNSINRYISKIFA